MTQKSVLKEVFGYDHFRTGQQELIDCVLKGQDVLGIMPTGAGKSLCYQVPALLFEGITLVVSPLISLMQDQVNALTQSGVAAAYINSSLSAGRYEAVLQNAIDGQYKIIYIAPERLTSASFLRFAKRADISMVTIDEAHCVSQWGQDFRPSYRGISHFVQSLQSRPVVSAFTATATSHVKQDIIDLLSLQKPHTLVTGFDRANLYFGVQAPKDKKRALLAFIGDNINKAGIVYCATRKNVEMVCGLLISKGYAATRYHAGLPDGERQTNQEDFLYDRKQIMVATNAFGMGIDKSNVSFVVHYNMPKNLESYYQEAGRAGRDGEPASCLLLYSSQDVHTNTFLINLSREHDGTTAEQEQMRQNDLGLLKKMTWYSTSTECLRRDILHYFGENAPVYCGNCSSCNTQFETVDITVDAQKIVSCVVRVERTGRPLGKTMVANILRGAGNPRIAQNGLDHLPTFGIMAKVPMRRMVQMIDYLVNQEYLCLTGEKYPVLRTTEHSGQVLRASKPVQMQLPKGEKETIHKELPHHGEREVLFESLRATRLAIARASKVPAYTVFTDASLRDMCARLPQTEEEFLEVSGVGNAKLERYGQQFIGMIKDYAAAAHGAASQQEE